MTEGAWQRRLERLQAAGRLPSVVAGVLRAGDLAWTGAVHADLTAQYRVGSITKTLTAVTVLQLRDQGQLSLEDPVGRFVPETGYAAATVRELLAHTSGMQSEPVGPWWERSPGVDFATLVQRNDGSGAVAGAGEWFHYSNLGFALLGEMVARLRGESWWEVVSRQVLDPLGMTRTTYHPQRPAAQGHSVHHFAGTLTLEPHQDTGAMAPAGQAWSTVEDLYRFAAFLATGREGVLAASSVREMARVQGPATDYGLGVRVLRHADRAYVGHTGSMPGFQASMFVDRGSGDGLVVLANATTGLDTDGVLDAFFLDEDPDPVRPWQPTTTLPAEVDPALGVWFWGNTAVELRWHDGELQLRDLGTAELTDTFVLRGDRLVGATGYHRGETLHVVRRADGAVSHLDCATFVYTRVPYDPDAPIPGGHPVPGQG